jgi:hypothetical protein
MAEEYGRFHASTLGAALPEWVPSAAEAGFASGWESVATDADCLAALASLAGDSADEASAWLSLALPMLSQAASEMTNIGPPFALLHLDTRSDNLRLTSDGLRLFDWPYAAVGPPELDLAAFAQSVPGEGGPSAQQMADWYAAAQPVREDALTACVSSVAAYFAQRAWQPPIEGLPRLRGVQRRQLKVSLRWAADRLALPEPHWLAAVPS